MSATPHLDISVVVPVLDDPAGVTRTVDALHRQTFPRERFEVLVVDNGSRDGTRAAAARAAAAGPATVHVLVEDRVRTSYGARNAGIAAARGRLLCFLDADVSVPPGYLTVVHDAVTGRGLDYAGCPVVVEVDRPTVAACHNRLFGFPVAEHLERRRWVPTCSLTVRRDLLDRIGPFDPTLASGGDVEFGRRAAAAGANQGLVTEVSVAHPARTNVAALTRKARRTAGGKLQLAHRDAAASAAASDAVRAYATWSRLRPVAPWWIRRQLAAAGLPAGWGRSLGVSLLGSWLGVVRVATVIGSGPEGRALLRARADRPRRGAGRLTR